MSTKQEAPKFKAASDVLAAIKLRYPAPAYAVITEVGNSTGFRCRRHADVVVMSLWPSRGLEVVGIEIKVSRQDWIRELHEPEKADEIHRYCDRWYLAVGSEKIVEPGELPKGWGLMVPKKDGGIRVSVEAELVKPEPKLDRGFIAAVLRKGCEQLMPEAQLQAERSAGFKEGRAECQRSHEYTIERNNSELNTLLAVVKKFEEASGVAIKNAWIGERIGEAVRQVLQGVHLRQRQALRDLKARALAIANSIEMELKANELLEAEKAQ